MGSLKTEGPLYIYTGIYLIYKIQKAAESTVYNIF